MSPRRLFLVVVLVAFTAYSTFVVGTRGYFGFLTLAWRERWGMQVLLDLTIALLLFWDRALADPRARARGPVWPWLVATVFLGSIAPLVWLLLAPRGGGDPRSHPAEGGVDPRPGPG